MEFEVLDELEDSETVDKLEDIASNGPIKDEQVGDASKFVLGYDNEDLVSYSSLKTSYPQKTGVDDYAVEIFQIGVDEELRGQGLGRETFERSLEEADRFGDETGLGHVYMTVWNDTTDLYQQIKETVEEEKGYFSDSEILEYCEERGIDAENLYKVNPINHLAEEYGFDSHDGSSFRNTVHIKERPVKEVESAAPVKARE